MEQKVRLDMLVTEEHEGGLAIIDIKDEYRKVLEELVIDEAWGVCAISPGKDKWTQPFSHCTALRRVKLPSTLRVLRCAFCDCTALEEVIFPEGLRELGGWNFKDCAKLTHVDLPRGMTRIGDDNFDGSPVLNADRDAAGGSYIGEYLLKFFSYRDEPYTVRHGTTLIAERAFTAYYMTRVSFPETLRYIGRDAFYHCGKLEEPTLPTSVVRVGKNAFYCGGREYFRHLYVTDGYIGEDGEPVVLEELGFFPPAELEAAVARFADLLLKVEGSMSYTYDNSDDDRVGEDSSSSYPFTKYCELDVKWSTKSLLRIDGEIVGVVFRVSQGSSQRDRLCPMLFDGRGSVLHTGYSASHSSQYLTVHSITLVKRGENGAPMRGDSSISFSKSKTGTSL